MSASRLFVDNGRGHAWRAALTVLAVALLAWPGMARAHDLGVARALLEELPGARYVLEVAVDPHLVPLFAPPELPERCGAPAALTPDLGTLRYEFACGGEPLTAEDVLRLPWQRQGVMLTVRWADGSTAREFFAGTGAATEVPLNALNAGSGSVRNAALRYLGLGIEHILLGIDHLLFVLGLLLLVSGPWMLIKTITAFTVAHSITLALATLGLVAVPPRPIDAAIALSIVFLGAEILRAPGAAGPRGQGAMGGRVRVRPAARARICRRACAARPAARRDPAGPAVLQPRRRDRPADVRRDLFGPGVGAARAPGRLAALVGAAARVCYWHRRRVLVHRAHERVGRDVLRTRGIT
jgi:HupE / UreJ protein